MDRGGMGAAEAIRLLSYSELTILPHKIRTDYFHRNIINVFEFGHHI
jgi:hypothetical protein